MSLFRRMCYMFGYELISENKSPTLRSHLRNIFELYKIDTVLDVGANNGQFASRLRKIGYQGNIYSFEPVAETYEKLLKRSEKDKQWHVFNMGLGDRACTKTINISKSSDLCSILSPTDFGKELLPNIEVVEKENITIDTVDGFIAREKIPDHANVFLKIDTQGYDMMVFAGARNSISRISAILTELSLIPIYENSTSYLESLGVFEKNSFKISGIYPISKKSDLTIVEMDCVLVNTNRSEW